MKKKNSIGKVILVSLAIVAMVGTMFTFLISALINNV